MDSFKNYPCVCVCVFLTRYDHASLRGVPSDLGLHAVHSSDLQHHFVSVPWVGVGDTKPYTRGMAPHPHHGHLQHVRLCRQGEVHSFWNLQTQFSIFVKYKKN